MLDSLAVHSFQQRYDEVRLEPAQTFNRRIGTDTPIFAYVEVRWKAEMCFSGGFGATPVGGLFSSS